MYDQRVYIVALRKEGSHSRTLGRSHSLHERNQLRPVREDRARVFRPQTIFGVVLSEREDG